MANTNTNTTGTKAAEAQPTTLCEQVAVEQLSPNEYRSIYNAGALANTAKIAYGGCSSGFAVNVAHQSVKPEFKLYSVLGYYLGPTTIDRRMYATVIHLRDTRSFATRKIEISQILDSGDRRLCMVVLCDFQTIQPSAQIFGTPPRIKYSDHQNSYSREESVRRIYPDNPQKASNLFKLVTKTFELLDTFFDTRQCPEGVSTQNFLGMVKQKPTTQDHLSLVERSSADWVKSNHPLPSTGEQMAALAFLMDAAISFTSLTHDKLFITDMAACSTLDFALRVLQPDIDLTKPNLRERFTISGDVGRTVSEGRMWNEKGEMVAIMTQTSIIRPFPGKEVSSAKL